MADEALGTLIDYRLGFVNIDQPAYAGATPPSALATSDIGYFRLHGRDPRYWKREFAGARNGARADNYLYSPGELDAWVDRIRHVRPFTRSTFVILANPAAGKSVVNGLQLASLLNVGDGVPRLAVA
jgi:uncharacterized protein YecE (DUF72 family)